MWMKVWKEPFRRSPESLGDLVAVVLVAEEMTDASDAVRKLILRGQDGRERSQAGL